MKHSSKVSLMISTFCILIINVMQLLDYLETCDMGGKLSTVCFIAADVCIVIAWIAFFIDRKKKQS